MADAIDEIGRQTLERDGVSPIGTNSRGTVTPDVQAYDRLALDFNRYAVTREKVRDYFTRLAGERTPRKSLVEMLREPKEDTIRRRAVEAARNVLREEFEIGRTRVTSDFMFATRQFHIAVLGVAVRLDIPYSGEISTLQTGLADTFNRIDGPLKLLGLTVDPESVASASEAMRRERGEQAYLKLIR